MGIRMSNLITFFNSFVSYLILFGVYVLLAVVAVFIGTTLRKRKNENELAGGEEPTLKKAE